MRLEKRPDAGYGAGFCSNVRSGYRFPGSRGRKGARASRYNTAMAAAATKTAGMSGLMLPIWSKCIRWTRVHRQRVFLRYKHRSGRALRPGAQDGAGMCARARFGERSIKTIYTRNTRRKDCRQVEITKQTQCRRRSFSFSGLPAAPLACSGLI
jgi:hypothetical protein